MMKVFLTLNVLKTNTSKEFDSVCWVMTDGMSFMLSVCGQAKNSPSFILLMSDGNFAGYFLTRS